jgi:membrane fusion protein (multidrug efflux system)
VEGFSAGTGAAFSLLPAQNATGNWIKVVQRLPVRIALDPQQLKDHPLRVGLSMNVTVDVRKEEGASLVSAKSARPLQTDVYDKVAEDADALIARIIALNNGGRVSASDVARPAGGAGAASAAGAPNAARAAAKPART